MLYVDAGPVVTSAGTAAGIDASLAHTGTIPYAWLLSQRVRLAERMLENGGLPVDEVARRSGFGSAAVLREHLIRERGMSPQAYRRTFRTAHGS